MNSGTNTPHEISHAIEVVATILPSDFAESMKLNRTIVESYTYTGQNIVQRWFACPDTSAAIYRDDLPQSGGSNGKIYSLDAPGLKWADTTSPGLIGRRRSNFTQWVTINQQNGNNVADVRVSDDIQWFHRLSIVKNDGPGFSVINDVQNDNQIGAGETPLAWNLSGDPASPPAADPCPALEQPQ